MNSIEPKLIVALDVDSITETKRLLNKLSKYVKIFKIGPYLFTRYGPKIIKLVHSYKSEVFLDLKLHDIPNTVANAVRQMVKLKVSILTLHTSGGMEMMKEAYKAKEDEAKKRNIRKPIILGITVLSSFNKRDLLRINIQDNIENQVVCLSRLAKKCHLDGVVASAKEAPAIKKDIGQNFIIASAGIRPANYKADDQKRVMTPKQAVENGVDYIIMGRPIIKSKRPDRAAYDIAKEISNYE